MRSGDGAESRHTSYAQSLTEVQLAWDTTPARRGPKMGARTPTPQGPAPRDQPVDPGPDHGPRPGPQPPAGATLNIGLILVRTIGHFFPDLNDWIDEIDDPRFAPLVVYHKRFLVW